MTKPDKTIKKSTERELLMDTISAISVPLPYTGNNII
jgi:hypothetical protein